MPIIWEIIIILNSQENPVVVNSTKKHYLKLKLFLVNRKSDFKALSLDFDSPNPPAEK